MLHSILNYLFGSNADGIDRTAFWTGAAALWTAIAAAGAIGAVLVARHELGRTAATTHADFAKRFVDSFFTPETRGLFTLLMNSALEFKILTIKDEHGKQIDELPFLEIRKAIAGQLKGVVDISPERSGYSAFEIDDLLLGPLDDIGWYENRGLIDMETIREMFGYYIYECYENQEIQKYLKEDCNEDKYENFKRLAKFIKDNPIERVTTPSQA
jgi:hypothetical protein